MAEAPVAEAHEEPSEEASEACPHPNNKHKLVVYYAPSKAWRAHTLHLTESEFQAMTVNTLKDRMADRAGVSCSMMIVVADMPGPTNRN